MNLHSFAKAKRQNKFEVLDPIICRWSPRSLNGEPVTPDELQPLFTAAGWAPSAFNNQPWRFYYACRGSESFERLFSFLVEKNQQWCKNTGCLTIVVSQKNYDHNGKPARTHAFDTGAAWHAFAAEGLRRNYVVHGMAGFDYQAATKFLNLGEDYMVQCIVAVGKPTQEIEKETISQRKPTEKIAIQLK